jgi:hypothetical protein
MLPLVAAGLVSAGIKGVTGVIQASQAGKQLNNLAKTPIDEYSISPELQHSYSRAEAMANQGFAPEEKAAFQSGVARQQAGAFQNAVDQSGGNLSSAIGAALKSQNIGVQSDFAAQGSRLRSQHMQYADELAGRIQSQKNLMTEAKRQRRTMLEQAYGAAKKQGIENITGALTGAAQIAGFGSGGGAKAANPNSINMQELEFNQNDYNTGGNDPDTIQ